MTIVPGQSAFQLAGSALPLLPGGVSSPGVNIRGKAGQDPVTESKQAVVHPPSFSTSMQIDNHHQVYYKFVEGGTGNVMFEIPPEALRDIAESLKMPPVMDGSVPTIDVKRRKAQGTETVQGWDIPGHTVVREMPQQTLVDPI